MGFLFSKPAPPKSREPTPAESAELDARRAKVRMTKFAKRNEAEADTLLGRAKVAARAGNKETAKRLLLVRKLKLKAVKTAWANVTKLEELVAGIETAQQQRDFVSSLARGTELLEQLNEALPIDRVEDLMDRTDDALAYQAEVDALIARDMDPASAEEVDAALDAIMQEDAPAAVPAAAVPAAAGANADEAHDLPAAPTGTHDAVDLPEAPSHAVPAAREAVPA